MVTHICDYHCVGTDPALNHNQPQSNMEMPDIKIALDRIEQPIGEPGNDPRDFQQGRGWNWKPNVVAIPTQPTAQGPNCLTPPNETFQMDELMDMEDEETEEDWHEPEDEDLDDWQESDEYDYKEDYDEWSE